MISIYGNPNSINMLSYSETDLNQIAKTDYHHVTHKGLLAVLAGDVLLSPAKLTLELLARTLTPCPGENKDQSPTIQIALKLAYLTAFLISIPLSIPFLIVGLPLLHHSYKSRSPLGLINASPEAKIKKEIKDVCKFKVRTHNIAMLYDHINILNDLRSPSTRAHELVKWIQDDPSKPSILCFQELFNPDAVTILCNDLKATYPYIIHSVAPRFLGFGAGLAVMSQYPIKKVTFRPFANVGGGEQIASKGLLRVRVEVQPGTRVDIYNTHLLSMLDRSRCEIRCGQLQEIINWIREDDPKHYILMGDLNISKVTIWNEINTDDDPSFQLLTDHFQVTLTDISPYVPGTWYHGPYCYKPLTWRLKELIDYYVFDYPYRQPLSNSTDSCVTTWGTKQWLDQPMISSTRFDYILLDKDSQLQSQALIRPINLQGNREDPIQSASSDHLAIDADIELKIEKRQLSYV
jgi:endonuclease/exonuclease/phosphatase family metal-dependent hydrolase